MKLQLLPNYFKKVALMIMVILVLFTAIVKLGHLNVSVSFCKSFARVSAILAGFLLIMAKEKIEDEYVQSIRLNAVAFSFIFGIIIYIIDESHLLDFISSKPYDTFGLIFQEIFMYILWFYLLKLGVIRFEKQCKRNTGTE